MRFTLKEYQEDAVAKMLEYFADARDDYHRKNRNVSFSLAATTGAGKTVMAAAVLEALFFGNDDFDFQPDPGAVVLWFTDDPSLNEQTRFRLMEAGDRISSSHLVVIENTFNQAKLEAGKVYFLNSQKLSRNSLLVRGAASDGPEQLFDHEVMPDLRGYTFWDTLRNTIEDESLTLYLVLDEAHKGMKRPNQSAQKERSTTVKRLVNGENDVPPVPVVWGISATIKRFTAAMAEAEGRTSYPNYEVDPAIIQESGLLKDDIRLHFPIEAGVFDTVLLRRGVGQIRESTGLWKQYADSQDSPGDTVVPLLVVQVPNTPSDDLLRSAVDTVYDSWPELRHDAIAHVFGDHSAIELGQYTIPWIAPEKVQESDYVRVLLAKDAISTGWDCPRAEVLVSFRPASEEVHITQLLGRMVRTPLARRVTGNDRLNSVECVLPFFNRKTATNVAEVLLGKKADDDDGSGGSGGGDGRRVLVAPVDMQVNAEIPEEIWQAFDSVPSQTLPRKAAKPTKRLTALAQALSRDGLLNGARAEAQEEMFRVLDGRVARHQDKLDEASRGILEVEGEVISAAMAGRSLAVVESFSELADDRSVQADFKEAQRVLSPDLALKYADRIAVADEDDDGLFDAHVKVAALARIEGVRDELDREADSLAQKWLANYRVQIKGLPDERRAVYDSVISMSSDPQRTDILRPRIRTEESETKDGTKIETREHHLMSDAVGAFPIGSLNDWEVGVLDAEMSRPDALAWYRNPSRASEDSLSIAYKDGQGAWRRMCPDFIFFHGTLDDVKVSIVDPHGIHLADALPKLRGLAAFAEQYGHDFHRIESVAVIDQDVPRVLDMKDPRVRSAVRAARDVQQLYMSPAAVNYTAA